MSGDPYAIDRLHHELDNTVEDRELLQFCRSHIFNLRYQYNSELVQAINRAIVNLDAAIAKKQRGITDEIDMLQEQNHD